MLRYRKVQDQQKVLASYGDLGISLALLSNIGNREVLQGSQHILQQKATQFHSMYKHESVAGFFNILRLRVFLKEFWAANFKTSKFSIIFIIEK